QNAALTNDTVNKKIVMTVTGDFLKWTGVGSSNWQLLGPTDWNLSPTGTPTTYQSTSGIEDAVVFDDSATSKTVSISAGNVAAPRVTFNNTSAGGAYTINGPSGIIGSAAVFINDTGTVTLSSPNSFSGGVTVANLNTANPSGRLNIGHDTAIGTG